MKKINLIYWDENNFGDVLNPKLVEELSGMRVQHKNIQLSIQDRICMVFKAVLSANLRNLGAIIFPWQRTYVIIGSVMSWAKADSFIWGAGFMNRKDKFKGGRTFAVRGKLTDLKLQDDGFPEVKVYGDPALLLPLWLKFDVKKRHKLGIIPHWKEVDYFKEKYGTKFHIIDLRTKDIEKVVEEIVECEYVLSTSLHGIIVAHAYMIPALWIQKGYIDTDGFKFHDYFSSVDIPFYEGFTQLDDFLNLDDKWMSLFEENKDKSAIGNSLETIQSNLLKVAPFPLRDKYRQVVQ